MLKTMTTQEITNLVKDVGIGQKLKIHCQARNDIITSEAKIEFIGRETIERDIFMIVFEEIIILGRKMHPVMVLVDDDIKSEWLWINNIAGTAQQPLETILFVEVITK